MMIPTHDRPSASSYENICAEERSPPSRLYLLLAAQPASTIPYTPRAVTAKMNSSPTSIAAICSCSVRPCSHAGSKPQAGSVNGGPYGSTATASSAVVTATTGAARKPHLLAPSGITSSLKKSLMPSAIGWRIPSGPVRFGPSRNCMNASSRRSIQVISENRPSSVPTTTAILTSARIRSCSSGESACSAGPGVTRRPRASRAPAPPRRWGRPSSSSASRARGRGTPRGTSRASTVAGRSRRRRTGTRSCRRSSR